MKESMTRDRQASTATKGPWKNPFLYSSGLLVVAAIYAGWILYTRHFENRAYERRAEEAQARKRQEADQAALKQLGGNELAIQMLYAPPRVHKGETAQVCFGVANAKTVTLEPQTNPVWPSHNLCVDVKPSTTTTYTLTATGADGKSVSQQLTVEVR